MTTRSGRGSSQDLVPRGLPHGERKRLVQTRRQAGLPAASRDVQSRASAVRQMGRTPALARGRQASQNFDALMQADPERVQPMFASRNAAIAETANLSLDERLAQTAESSNNDFLRGVVQRMRVLRGGR